MTIDALILVLEKPVAYAEGVALQERLLNARIADRIPDVVVFLEHRPVVTLGVRASVEHLLLSRVELAARGIELVRSSRGGDVTFHAPGQVVLYPILKLRGKDADSHDYLHALEEVAIRAVADFGVEAFRRPKMTGAWTSKGKLAAIGVRLRRWVTFHGMALNVNPDLAGFAAIVPCGLHGEPVTSLKELLGPACPRLPEVRRRLSEHFAKVFQRRLRPTTLEALDLGTGPRRA